LWLVMCTHLLPISPTMPSHLTFTYIQITHTKQTACKSTSGKHHPSLLVQACPHCCVPSCKAPCGYYFILNLCLLLICPQNTTSGVKKPQNSHFSWNLSLPEVDWAPHQEAPLPTSCPWNCTRL
jgi:hypothetical protein